MSDNLRSVEVIVIGGGLAGMSAAIHLAKAGLKVICLEADVENSDPVGESLDWSAPELLKSLGFPMDRLLHEGIATWKRHVMLNPGTRRGRIGWDFQTIFSGARRRRRCMNSTHDPHGNITIQLGRRQLKLRSCHVLAPRPKINVK